MTTSGRLPRLWQRATTQRNVTIYGAILLGVSTAYAFHRWSGTDGGAFLLLLLVAVGVPTAFDEFEPDVEGHPKALAWVVAAGLVVAVEYTGAYVVGTAGLSLSPLLASVGAFLSVWVTNYAYLVVRARASD